MIILISIAIILGILYFTLLINFYTGWKRLKKQKSIPGQLNTSVSVIIAARNEEKNIIRLLKSIQAQNFPKHLLEVIVIDDHSEDNTFQLASGFEMPESRVVKLKDHLKAGEQVASFKKRAIETGISLAGNQLIVTTDADCRMNENWLASIVALYEKRHPAMIAGPVLFENEKKPFDYFQSLENLGLMAITGGTIKSGSTGLCNGANLAYEKAAFEKVGGFKSIDNISSGDDMLLMQKIHDAFGKGSILFLKSRYAVVYTHPERSGKDYLHQRLRWIAKTRSFSQATVLTIFSGAYLFNFFILFLFIYSFIFPEIWSWFMALFLLKAIPELLLIASAARFFRKLHLLKWFLPSTIFYTFYVLFIGVAGFVITPKWKGRKIEK